MENEAQGNIYGMIDSQKGAFDELIKGITYQIDYSHQFVMLSQKAHHPNKDFLYYNPS